MKRKFDPSAGVKKEAKRLQESPSSMLRRRPAQRLMRFVAAKLTPKKIRMRPEFVDVMLEATESFTHLLLKSATIVAMRARGVKTIKQIDLDIALDIARIWGVEAITRLPADVLPPLQRAPAPERAAPARKRAAGAAKPRGPKSRADWVDAAAKPAASESVQNEEDDDDDDDDVATLDEDADHDDKGGAAAVDDYGLGDF